MASNCRNNPLDKLPTHNIPRRLLKKSDPFSFEPIANGYKTTETNYLALPNNYTFDIRGWGCFAIAKGKISNTSGDLKAMLYDSLGHNILEIRKLRHFMITPRALFNFFRRSNELIPENNLIKFDVHEGGTRVGQITIYGISVLTETCLQIFRADNKTQLVVRSLCMGQFSVFRDESSPSPLCVVKSYPLELDVYSSDEFRTNIEFYSKAEITIEEQKLCTAAAFAYKICVVQRSDYLARQLLKINATPQKSRNQVE